MIFAVMKGMFFFLISILSIFFLQGCEVAENITAPDSDEARLEEKIFDLPQRLEELSSEFKSRTCLLPRRTVQLVNLSVHIREQKVEKAFLQCRIKSENQHHKISELNSDCQILKLSSLLCRKGYFVYALRKLLI